MIIPLTRISRGRIAESKGLKNSNAFESMAILLSRKVETLYMLTNRLSIVWFLFWISLDFTIMCEYHQCLVHILFFNTFLHSIALSLSLCESFANRIGKKMKKIKRSVRNQHSRAVSGLM